MTAHLGIPETPRGATRMEAELGWQEKGLCRSVSVEFYPEKNGKPSRRLIREAVQVCESCEVREVCLEWALTHDEGQYGIWGALTAAKRRKILKERRAAS